MLTRLIGLAVERWSKSNLFDRRRAKRLKALLLRRSIGVGDCSSFIRQLQVDLFRRKVELLSRVLRPGYYTAGVSQLQLMNPLKKKRISVSRLCAYYMLAGLRFSAVNLTGAKAFSCCGKAVADSTSFGF